MTQVVFKFSVDGEDNLPVVQFLDEIQGFLSRLPTGGVSVALCGELGAGKTTFVRYLIRQLGLSPSEVSSPTYTLQRIYQINKEIKSSIKRIDHWDVYRLGALPSELLERIPAGTLQLIEWADKFSHPTDYSLSLEQTGEHQRTVKLVKI